MQRGIPISINVATGTSQSEIVMYRGDNVKFEFTFTNTDNVPLTTATKLRVQAKPAKNLNVDYVWFAGETTITDLNYNIEFTSDLTSGYDGDGFLAVLLLDANNQTVCTGGLPFRVEPSGYDGIFNPSQSFRDEVIDAKNQAIAAKDAAVIAKEQAETAKTAAETANTQAQAAKQAAVDAANTATQANSSISVKLLNYKKDSALWTGTDTSKNNIALATIPAFVFNDMGGGFYTNTALSVFLMTNIPFNDSSITTIQRDLFYLGKSANVAQGANECRIRVRYMKSSSTGEMFRIGVKNQTGSDSQKMVYVDYPIGDISNYIHDGFNCIAFVLNAASSETGATPQITNIRIYINEHELLPSTSFPGFDWFVSISNNFQICGQLTIPKKHTAVKNIVMFLGDAVNRSSDQYNYAAYMANGGAIYPWLLNEVPSYYEESDKPIFAFANFTITNGSTTYIPDLGKGNCDATIELGSLIGDDDASIAKMKQYFTATS